MRKRKQVLKRPSRARAACKQGPPENTVERGAVSGESIPAFETLLNKYNQKRPSGHRKASPAADEEME